MPHRTVFQWGNDHAHPFTMFIGGFVVGVLVAGAAAYAWFIVDEVDEVDVENVVEVQASPEVTAAAEATASPVVQF